MQPDVIYYHRDKDGSCAAWSALQGLGDTPGKVTVVRSVNYGEPLPPPEEYQGKNVWVLDFTWPQELLRNLLEEANQLVIIDHHQTGGKVLLQLIEECFGTKLPPSETYTYKDPDEELVVHFDLHRSGAGLTWDVVHPEASRPWFVDYVEDRDLWRWAMPDSKAVNLYLSTLPPGIETFDTLPTQAQAAELGQALLAFEDRLVHSACSSVTRMRIAGFNVPAVNSSVLQSEIGNLLAQDEPFAVVWWHYIDGPFQYGYSLRSVEGGENVAVIAESFGGGGHKHAAGFSSEKLFMTFKPEETA